MPAWLVIEEGPGKPREVRLKGQQVVIGRGADCDVVIGNPLASRQHVRLWRGTGRYHVEDLNSRNGTWVNGERLTPRDGPEPGKGRLLADGDEIGLGGGALVRFRDSDATASPTSAKGGRILRLDEARRDVWVQDRRLVPRLPPAQYALLRLLLARAGAICSRDEIAAAVRPAAEADVSNQALDALLKRLRARLKTLADDGIVIRTIRGHGFTLTFPESGS